MENGWIGLEQARDKGRASQARTRRQARAKELRHLALPIAHLVPSDVLAQVLVAVYQVGNKRGYDRGRLDRLLSARTEGAA